MYSGKMEILQTLGWTKLYMEIYENQFTITGFYVPPYNSNGPLQLKSNELLFEEQTHKLVQDKSFGNYQFDVLEVNASGEVVALKNLIQIYTAYQNGERANSHYHDWYWIRSNFDKQIPDLDMMMYIGADNSNWYHFAGATWAVKSLDLWTQFTSKKITEIGKILDYGCGVARISKHYLELCESQITGIDIDKKSINWCQENIPEATWIHLESDSQIPLKDNSIDLIVGHSVFTHFEEDTQMEKLNELSRVLNDEGLLLLTVLGEYAHFLEPLTQPEEEFLYTNGIICPKSFKEQSKKHPLMKGSYPDYHKGVFNTYSFIKNKWTKHLEVLAIIEGFADHQALVVLKKRIKKV